MRYYINQAHLVVIEFKESQKDKDPMGGHNCFDEPISVF